MSSFNRLLLACWLLLIGFSTACATAHIPAPLPTAVPTAVATPAPLPTATALPPVTPTKGADTAVSSVQVPTYTYQIINAYPHDPNAFTQGLVFHRGVLYEGTGRNGYSSIRLTNLETGSVLQQRDLGAEYFGEGITIWQDRLIQLTWQSGVGFIYDLTTFAPLGSFSYPGEGWGLTHDDQRLIMSDGTDVIRFLDLESLAENGRIQVHDQNGPVMQLNELEYINGEIWANIWQTNTIARISPQTGQVVGWIDLTGLLNPADLTQPADVLNGIAYDANHDRLFVTGKWWPKIFEIKLILEPSS